MFDAPGLRTTFRAVARTVVPETSALGAPQWTAVEATIAHALALRPAGVRRQLALFLRVVSLLALPRYGRRFAALAPGQQTRLLEALQRGPLLLLRRGVWGLRTLVFLGYYTLPEVADAIGYRAHPRGWEHRR